jgi:hypothetical protein
MQRVWPYVHKTVPLIQMSTTAGQVTRVSNIKLNVTYRSAMAVRCTNTTGNSGELSFNLLQCYRKKNV